MKRIGLLFILGIALMGVTRPAETALFQLLNGVPVRLGVITTTGASTTNASTAVAFTVTGGTVLQVVCDAAAFLGVGASASTSYTNAAFQPPIASGAPRWIVMRTTDTTLAVASAAAVNCVVFQMQ